MQGRTKQVRTLALLDEGSTVSLIDREIARELGAIIMKENVTLCGLNETRLQLSVLGKMRCSISGTIDVKYHDLKNVYVVNDLTFPPQSVRSEDLESYPHLHELPIDPYEAESPRIVLGQDNWDLIVSRQLVYHRREMPAASLTLLGWVVHGMTKYRDCSISGYNLHIKSLPRPERVSRPRTDDDLHALVKSHFAFESLGVSRVARVSESEKRAKMILKNTTRFSGDHWETGLLWGQDQRRLPNNYASALSRLKSLERKLDREPEFAKLYYKEMDRLISERYAVEIAPAAGCDSVWYLPHFGVLNENKPNKVRLVFDAAHRHQGVSLNDMLLTGPDLLQSLFGMLLSFRVGRVAFKGDIRDMFLRIKICTKDQDSQRFLWRGENRTDPPRVFKMTSMLFGAKSSPCSAIYVKNKNAECMSQEYPRSSASVVKRSYMDDHLESVDSVDLALDTINEVTKINARAGFEMHSWTSNSREVNSILKAKDPGKTVKLEASDAERALGLQWDTERDAFMFSLRMEKIMKTVDSSQVVPTKRQVLRVVMSVYDPLGLLGPFMIRAKILLQDIWRRGTGWDEPLSAEDAATWTDWVKQLPSIKRVAIPRCFTETTEKPKAIELHTFSDASEKAYAAVAYARIVYGNGDVTTRLIAGKCYVAPLKPSTIPRLELQAAVIGSRLAHIISTELPAYFTKKIFWTDSRTVLCWIKTDPRHYKPYVANRLGEIDESTDSACWKWVPTADNPADDATKAKEMSFGPEGIWQNGPKFLREPEENWPQQPPITRKEFREKSQIEARTTSVFHTYKFTNSLPDPTRFSRWSRLLGATARVLVVKDRWCHGKKRDLTVDDLQTAEKLWIREMQRAAFPREIEALSKKLPVPSDSRLVKLTPLLTKDGFLRAQGRVSALEGVPAFKNDPIILDGSNYVTRLIVAHYHARHAHANTETVMNELRQKYWILRARVTLRTVASRCALCQLRRAKPSQPRMADLPAVRLGHGLNAFSHCGIDYFGPITVTIGRRHEKRWGVLFTCLTMRAVHLEIAHSLSADSTIMAIQRMTARRGQPSILFSDNGTNLRGANEELKTAFLNMDRKRLQDYGARVGTKWLFIPPASPHMGGAWESLVKSVKRAIYHALDTKSPREEVLQTLFAEAEHSVNSRPLTFVSREPGDWEAITPNHVLFGASTKGNLPRRYEEMTGNPRRLWVNAQEMADRFWQRWRQEYLPTLIPRNKWTQESENIGIGNVVVIYDENSPRNFWKKGVIEEVHTGTDGRVRSASVRTSGGLLDRPVTKLIKLESASDANKP